MARIRRLWTGPPGAMLSDRALREDLVDRTIGNKTRLLWLAPRAATERLQMQWVLSRGAVDRALVRFWTWDELWSQVVRIRDDAPALLAPAARRVVLRQAIAQARRSDGFQVVHKVLDLAGFRRMAARRFDSWTATETNLKKTPKSNDLTTQDLWKIYRAYRLILQTSGAEDDVGLAVWASKSLTVPALKRFVAVDKFRLVGLPPRSTACLRALRVLVKNARDSLAMIHSVEYDNELTEVYQSSTKFLKKFRDYNPHETKFTAEESRPSDLVEVEDRLFRIVSESSGEQEIRPSGGLLLQGAPWGEGEGLVAARRIETLIGQGVAVDSIRVATPRWDEYSEDARRALEDWGFPVHCTSPRTLAQSQVVSTLVLAATLPGEDWEAARLIKMLRNRRFAWSKFEIDGPAAATAIQASRVYRGLAALRHGLRQLISDPRKKEQSGSLQYRAEQLASQATQAMRALDYLEGLSESFRATASWTDHVDCLKSYANACGLMDPEQDDQEAEWELEHLWNALEDHGGMLSVLPPEVPEAMTWPGFLMEVKALVKETALPTAAASAAALHMCLVDELVGDACDHLIVMNLSEGTLPSIEPPRVGDAPRKGELSRHSHAMLSFLELLAVGRRSVMLIHPTTNPRGQEISPARYIDDLIRLIPADARSTPIQRIDPCRRGELAGSAVDRRVDALANALSSPEIVTPDLRALLRQPRHHLALQGIAAALRMIRQRSRTRSFSAFEGRLRDPAIRRKITEEFDSTRPILSPTTLESYVLCPFQYFCRHVLSLQDVQERSEFEDDFSLRGRRIHMLLEQAHTRLQAESLAGPPNVEQVKALILEAILELESQSEPPPQDTADEKFGGASSKVQLGIKRIELGRLRRLAIRYVGQLAEYLGGKGRDSVPVAFELRFGRKGDDGKTPPPLEVGRPPYTVFLQGSIDRVDRVGVEGTRFRVIDYKTGAVPTLPKVKAGEALQLPLYALAVDKLGLIPQLGGEDQVEFGYWGLYKKGYAPIQLEDWAMFSDDLHEFISQLVFWMRTSVFYVSSRDDDCTKSCEHSSMCRVGQIRHLGKSWAKAPLMSSGDDSKLDEGGGGRGEMS